MARSISFDISAADRASAVIAKVGKTVGDLGEKIKSASGDVEVGAKDAQVDELLAKLERIDGRKLKVDADISNAQKRLEDLQKLKEKATTETGKVRIDADITKAQAKIEQLKKEKVALDYDTSSAKTKLNQLESDTDKKKKDIEKPIEINFGGLSSISSVITSLSGVTAALGSIAALAAVAAGALAGIGAVGGLGIMSVVAGFSGIGDALTAMEDDAGSAGAAVKASASEIKSAQLAVKNAEEDLADAQKDEKRAQDDLTDARKDAARTLRDLAMDTADMALRQQDAALSVTESEERLHEVYQDAESTATDRRRAELNLAEAKLRVKEVDISAMDLAEKKADADSKGIEKSDQVVSAQDRIAQAQSRSQDATERLAAAQEALVKTMNPEQVASGPSALAKALEDLGPKAREFVTFMNEFTNGPLLKLKQAGQEAFLPGIQSGLQSLSTALPGMAGPFAEFSGTMGRAIGEIISIAGTLSAPFLAFSSAALAGLAPLRGTMQAFSADLGSMMTSAVDSGQIQAAMGGLAGILGAVLPLITDLMGAGIEAGATLGPSLGTAFSDISAALQPIIGAMPELSKSFGGLLTAVTPLLKPLGEIIAALGPTFMDSMASIATSLQPVFDGLAAMATELAKHPEVMQGVVAAAAALSTGMGPLTNVFNMLKPLMAGVSAPMLVVVGVLALLAAGVIYAWNNSETFRTKVQALWAALQSAFGQVSSAVMPALNQLGDTIKTQVVPALGAFVEAITPIITWLVEKLAPIVSAIFAAIITNIRAAMTIISGIINVVVGIITGDWTKSWEGIKQIVSGAFTVIGNTFRTAKTVIAGVASGMWDGVKNAFKAVLNWIIGAWNKLNFSVPSFTFAGVTTPGMTLGLPKIPLLADGGIVTSPTLAMIGEAGPEAVIPLSRARNALSGGGRNGAVINVNVTTGAVLSDRYALAAEVVAALREAVARGMLPAGLIA